MALNPDYEKALIRKLSKKGYEGNALHRELQKIEEAQRPNEPVKVTGVTFDEYDARIKELEAENAALKAAPKPDKVKVTIPTTRIPTEPPAEHENGQESD